MTEHETHNAQSRPLTRERQIYRVTIVGSIANLLLLTFKFAAGIFGRSAAMTADAVHSLSDFITDIIVLVFVRISARPQDKKYDYGYGKYETVATVVVACLLFVIGLGIMRSSAIEIWGFFKGEIAATPQPIALIAALVSIVVKEILYHYTAIRGKRIGSDVVVANAWHHRSDAFTSVGTAIGIGGAILLGGKWSILDPLAALIMSLFILRIAIKLFLPSFGELTETSLPEETEREIEDIILAFPAVSDPHHMRTRRIGSYCALDIHIRMNKDMTLGEVHAVADQIEHALRDKFGPSTLINIHVEPEK
ncbi:MAG: cation diffusion facilitator family transporter [Prevotella sp.]|nr:cation diffusion facilitator family transporter [Prevotella sp.]